MLLRQVHFTAITVVCIPLIFAVFVFVSYFHDGIYHLSPSGLSLTSGNNDAKPPQASASRAASTTPIDTGSPAANNEELEEAAPTIPSSSSKPGAVSQKVFPATEFLPARPVDPTCKNFPDVSKLLLIIKTGGSETYDRLPTLFMTMTRCLPDFLVFSDREEEILGYHVTDILDKTVKKVQDRDDFNLWRRQKQCVVDQKSCQQFSNAGGEAWNLDKYKNVRQSYETFQARPNYDWYIHIDADTYVHWPNMVQMLKPFNPKQDYFFGSFEPSQYGDFNHGGSGYILSHSAMQKFHANASLERFDDEATRICCGDMLMTIAVRENIGLANTNMFPTINGRKPFTLPFGPRQWCQPIATLHKLNSEEVASIWEFEQRRIANHSGSIDTLPPLLIKDLYYEYFAPRLVPKLEDWNNMYDDYFNNVWYYIDYEDKAKDWEHYDNQLWVSHRVKQEDKSTDLQKKAHKSFDDCKRACDEHKECLQFRWQNDMCAMSKNFRLGSPMRREDKQNERWMSGWAIDKINKWIADQGECKVEFPQP